MACCEKKQGWFGGFSQKYLSNVIVLNIDCLRLSVDCLSKTNLFV
jgi:hypothetical protein